MSATPESHLRWPRWKLQWDIFTETKQERICKGSVWRLQESHLLVWLLCSVTRDGWAKAAWGDRVRASFLTVSTVDYLTLSNLSPWWSLVIFATHYHQSQREGRGKEEWRNSSESVQPLVHCSAPSAYGEEAAVRAAVVTILCVIPIRPLCCQAILSGLYGNDLWDERRKGELSSPCEASSKREGC